MDLQPKLLSMDDVYAQAQCAIDAYHLRGHVRAVRSNAGVLLAVRFASPFGIGVAQMCAEVVSHRLNVPWWTEDLELQAQPGQDKEYAVAAIALTSRQEG